MRKQYWLSITSKKNWCQNERSFIHWKPIIDRIAHWIGDKTSHSIQSTQRIHRTGLSSIEFERDIGVCGTFVVDGFQQNQIIVEHNAIDQQRWAQSAGNRHDLKWMLSFIISFVLVFFLSCAYADVVFTCRSRKMRTEAKAIRLDSWSELSMTLFDFFLINSFDSIWERLFPFFVCIDRMLACSFEMITWILYHWKLKIFFLFTDDEINNSPPLSFVDKTKKSKDELQTRLEFFLQHKSPLHEMNGNIPPKGNGTTAKHIRNTSAFSSFTSSNTSPVSTLTGSSEADVPRNIQDSNVYSNKICTDSIGSLMSVSMFGQSNGSMSPSMMRRHSVTSEFIEFWFNLEKIIILSLNCSCSTRTHWRFGNI